jgi:hypothetical protein
VTVPISPNACPVCRTEMQPTWHKEIRGSNGDVVRRLPQDYTCPNACLQRLSADEYNAAIRQLQVDRAAE